ncbi:hypothetical protein BKA70DRAFT_1215912 [Coprinopsis sp. MPI-PUGE-AT-0042]|nr:hypothetical protein BKA70DRAFT_1215912 [Coprinopsis sp. MPI-PUGE-AT-0042]
MTASLRQACPSFAMLCALHQEDILSILAGHLHDLGPMMTTTSPFRLACHQFAQTGKMFMFRDVSVSSGSPGSSDVDLPCMEGRLATFYMLAVADPSIPAFPVMDLLARSANLLSINPRGAEYAVRGQLSISDPLILHLDTSNLTVFKCETFYAWGVRALFMVLVDAAQQLEELTLAISGLQISASNPFDGLKTVLEALRLHPPNAGLRHGFSDIVFDGDPTQEHKPWANAELRVQVFQELCRLNLAIKKCTRSFILEGKRGSGEGFHLPTLFGILTDRIKTIEIFDIDSLRGPFLQTFPTLEMVEIGRVTYEAPFPQYAQRQLRGPTLNYEALSTSSYIPGQSQELSQQSQLTASPYWGPDSIFRMRICKDYERIIEVMSSIFLTGISLRETMAVAFSIEEY